MGCSQDRIKKPINEELVFEKIVLECEDIDDLIALTFEKLAKIEHIRGRFAILSNEFEYYTGATMLRIPDVISCLYGMFWTLAKTLIDVTDSFEIIEEFPYISFRNIVTMAPEPQQIVKSFSEYFDFFTKEEKNRIEGLFEEFSILKDKLRKKISSPKLLFEKFQDESYIKIPKLKQYLKNVEEGFKILYVIKRTFLDNEVALRNFIEVLKQKSELEYINCVGKEARHRGLGPAIEVVATFSREIIYRDMKIVYQIREDDLTHKAKYKHYLEVGLDMTGDGLLQQSARILNFGEGNANNPNANNPNSNDYSAIAPDTPKILPEDEKPKNDSNMNATRLTEQEEILKKKEEEKLLKAECKELLEQNSIRDKELLKVRKKQEKLGDLQSNLKKNMFNNIAFKINNPLYIVRDIPLKSWNIGFKKSIITENSQITSIAFLTDLDVIVTGDNNGNVTFWSLAQYKQLFTKPVHRMDVSAFCYLNDGATLFSAGADGKVAKLSFNIEGNKLNFIVSEKEEGPILGLVSCQDGDHLLSAIKNKIVYWDIKTCNCVREVEIIEHDITSLIFITELKSLVIGCRNSTIRFFIPATYCLDFTISNAHNNNVVTALTTCVVNDKTFLCSSGEDMKLNFWDLEEKTLFRTETFNSIPISLGYCSDYKTIILILDSGVFTLFNYDNGQKKDYFTRKIPFTCGLYCGDGRTFITSCVDSSLEFYGIK